LSFDDFQRRRLLDAVFRDQPRKSRGFENAEPDIEANPDQHDADKKRDAPTPG
jgi:hypothetical protein